MAVSSEPTLRRRDPEARPHQILDAAFKEFGERGLAGARLDDIAKGAGVAKGTIYLYFPNKEALFREMVRVTIVDALQAAEASRDDLGDEISATEQIRMMAGAWWHHLRGERQQVLTRLVHGELHRFPDLFAFYGEEVIARGRRLVASVIARGVARGEFRPIDPMVGARMYAALWMSHGTWCSTRQIHPWLGSDEQVLSEMLEFFFHALKP
jgi:AcrR family transcriptional regulator